MDMGDKEKFELEKRNEEPMNYHSPSNMSSDWRFSAANISNASMGMVPSGNPMAVCKGDLMGSSSCSTASMVDSYSPTLWDHSTNSLITGYGDINVQNNASPSSILGIRKGGPASLRNLIDRTLDMSWNPPNSLLKGGIFLPNGPGMLPQSLSQFPADSAFIERAARFSSFNGGSFSDMMNPFYIPDSMALYSRGGGVMQEQQDVYAGNGLKSTPGGQKNELNDGEASKIVSVSLDQGATEGSPLKNDRRSESLLRSHDEAKQGAGGSGNESDEAEFSGGGDQDEPCMLDGSGKEPSAKGIGLKKRKRNVQGTEPDQTKEAVQQPGDSAKTEIQQKGDQNPTSAAKRTTGKHGKQGSQASDSPKEDYIHIRARRGQATNSHSLAERVRREKISERMKYLQDLVPGCSKVTGKAVMLDEIINYVQSLQRQVEFLSMKLATVNPRLDFNIEGLLAKDILQSRAGPSSSLMFTPDTSMAYPLQHPSYSGLIQAGVPGLGSSSNMLRRSINPQLTPMSGGLKEPAQLPNMWEDELHNVVQMNYGTSGLLSSQEVNESSPPGQMKVELK